MKKLKLYLDTSIINFALDERNPRNKNVTLKLFGEIKRGSYDVFVSEVVTAEIDKAPQDIAVRLHSAIKELGVEELRITEEVEKLAEKYIEHSVIPAKYWNDALHIAVATINYIDVIVSWNFEHIVKVKTKREVVGINSLMGYYVGIEIYSPLEVVGDV